MAENKKYYWLKMKRDFFKRHDVRIIERTKPNGKEYALFYVKLMLESIDHEGTLRFSEEMPYDNEMLAAVTDTEIDIVEGAMSLFQKLNIVEIFEDKTIFLPGVQKLIGSAVENDSAKRQRRYRERKKQETLQNVTVGNVTDVTPVTVGNVTRVTKDNESKSIDKDIDIELDIEIEKERGKEISCEQVADLYKTLCPSLPSLEILSDSIKTDLKESITKYGLENFKRLFEKAEASTFLKGDNERKWIATFDWLIKVDNVAKVLNGNFDNKKTTPKGATYDLSLAERMLEDQFKEKKQPETAAENESIRVRAEALKKELQGG